VALTISGRDLLAALDTALAGQPIPVQVSGITIRYDATRRPGQRIREVWFDGGERLDRRATYRVVVPQGLFELAGFAGWAVRDAEALGVTDRQALRRYLGLLRQPVEAPAGERVTVRR
jgi:hypothetical protein